MFFHVAAAVSFGWIHVPALALPTDREMRQPNFVMHDPVHVRSDAMQSTSFNPIDAPPSGNGPSTTAKADLDPDILKNIRQQPLPALMNPPVPDPSKVIATAPVTPGLPLGESSAANIAAQITKIQIGPLAAGPVSPAMMAQQQVDSNFGKLKPGDVGGSTAGGNGSGEVPGFTEVEKDFKPSSVTNPNIIETRCDSPSCRRVV